MTVTQKLNKLKYSKTLAFLLCVSIIMTTPYSGPYNLSKYDLVLVFQTQDEVIMKSIWGNSCVMLTS